MKITNVVQVVRSIAVFPTLLGISSAEGEARWEVPLGGNTFLTQRAKVSGDKVEAAGIVRWRDRDSVFSVFFRADRAAFLDVSLRLKAPRLSTFRATIQGVDFERKVEGPDTQVVALGQVKVKESGYVRVDLQGLDKRGDDFAMVSDLLVASATAGLELAYVKDNESSRFYWGRRGPSIHLRYDIPAGETAEYFYNEVTVPKGQDPIGSYFMANGFGQGYFGMQVNGPEERRVLFSVWSPFSTDNPTDIPEDQQVELLAKGMDVHGGEFGGEGSGGQSFLPYPWKAGTTYCFLNRACPDGKGHTIYTAWFFAPEAGKWRLVGKFRRPKTDTHLTGIHSFLENFADWNGYVERGALYGNQWARTTKGKWIELTSAHFSGDDIASRGYRLDYAGGASDGRFFMRNGGFFSENVKLGSVFARKSTRARKPEIDFGVLEAND